MIATVIILFVAILDVTYQSDTSFNDEEIVI
jgi:hypothetical protein